MPVQKLHRSTIPRIACTLAAVLLAGCDQTTVAPTLRPDASATLHVQREEKSAVLAVLGGRIFRDANLSLLRNQSCESCHDPAWGFSAPNVVINARGSVMPGSTGKFGTRKPPSAAYATPSPVLFFDEEGTPIGGNFWDGHASGSRLGSPAA